MAKNVRHIRLDPSNPSLILKTRHSITPDLRDRLAEAWRQACETGALVVLDASVEVYQKVDGEWRLLAPTDTAVDDATISARDAVSSGDTDGGGAG
jgi:hypothetical protein